MAYRTYRRRSAKAKWSRNLILFAIQLLLITLVLHRFADLYTPAALALFAIGFTTVALAILLAMWAMVQIWNRGFWGTGTVLFSVILAGMVFAGPALFLPKFLSNPALNDISTDTSAPPSFEVLAERRGIGANSIIYPKEKFSHKQEQAYPDIRPLILDRSTKEAYELMQEAIRRMRWEVVAKQAPGEDGSAGWIEATDKTMVVGFVDDIVVRVAGDETSARVDMRSASRYGVHDLGRNAKRIRELFNEVKTSLAIGERAVRLKAEIKKHQAFRIKEAERKRREKAQRAAEEAAAFEQVLQQRRQALKPQQSANTEAFQKPRKHQKRRRRRAVDIDDWGSDR